MTPTRTPLARRIAAGLLMSGAVTGALYELLRRWWIGIDAAGIGEGE